MRLSRDGVKELGEDIPKAVRERSLSFLTLLTRLRQTCCDPALLPWMDAPIEQSGKIMVLMEKLTEILANGHKVVIFSQFVSLLSRVENAIRTNFSDTPMYQLTGKTIDRATPVVEFQEQEGPGVMLVSLRAGGTGITLHSADYVFLMDPWWNPAVEEQAIDRVHRFGQDKPVFVYRMITEGTIEARIQKLKSDKKGIFSGILGEMNDISNMKHYFDSLSDLIGLLPEAK
jgi:SNF2 family DNA or RNA helicase